MAYPQNRQNFKKPMQHRPELATPSKLTVLSREDKLRQELGLDEGEEPPGVDDDEELDGDAFDTRTTATMSQESMEYQALSQELKRKESHNQQLLVRLKRYEGERNHLRQELEHVKQAQSRMLKIQKKNHEQVLADKDRLTQNMQDIISEKEAQLQGDASAGKKAAASIQRLVDQISSLHKDKTSLMESALQSEREVEDARGELSSAGLRWQQRVEKLQAKLEAMQTESPPSRKETQPATAKDNATVKQLELEVKSLQQQLATSTASQKQQQLDVALLEEDIKKLKMQNSDLHQQLELQCKKTTEVSNKEVLRLQQQLEAAQSESSNVNKQLKSVQQDLQRQQQSNGELQQQVRQLQAIRKELESQSQESGRQRSNVQKELSQSRVDKEVLEGRLTAMSSDMSNLQELISELESGQERLQEERRQLQCQLNDHEQLAKSLDQTEKQLVHNEAQRTRLQDELEKSRSEFTANLAKAHDEKASAVAAAEAAMRAEMADVQQRMTGIANHAVHIQRELVNIKHARDSMRRDLIALQAAVAPTVREMRRQILKAISEIDSTNKELVRKYKKEMALRKKYHNEIIELKGNIRVFGRVRPTIREDGEGKQAEHVVRFDDDDDGLVLASHRGATKTFELDKVFRPGSTQEQVFDELKSLIVSCVDGYNVCIFAYGQTGSGKTFTMEGPPENPGINPRALRELFEVARERGQDWDYSIAVSVMEIYNEQIRDLLSDDPTVRLEVKQSRTGDGHYVPGLNWIRVENVHDVQEVFALGHQNRATAVTDMNEHSSRSHALLCISVTGVNKTTNARTIGRLNLVDLAGSERLTKSGSEGMRLKEAQNINKSLSALGDVIHSLKGRSGHVPYRNSKLTYLLQDSLGGDSKTLMMVQISPVEKNSSETLCSLNFAQRVKTVELGQASRRLESADVAASRDRLRDEEEPTVNFTSRLGSAGTRKPVLVTRRKV